MNAATSLDYVGAHHECILPLTSYGLRLNPGAWPRLIISQREPFIPYGQVFDLASLASMPFVRMGLPWGD